MKTLVTSALPYANGPMHLGHVRSTYIPADIYVRFLRARGEDVKYVCGTDEHGTPIAIKAEAEGTTPKAIGDRYHKIIADELARLGISFDNFSQTSNEAHNATVHEFYNKIRENGHIFERPVKQLYCGPCKRFLPDRYVVGICSYCGAQARGDHCEACGRHLNVTDLKEPMCMTCEGTPEIVETTHYFFKLSQFSEKLKDYLKTAEISENAKNYASGWLKELNDWDISRDLSWGVKIPGTDKVFYVWFDAPIGYMSFTKEAFSDWEDYWRGKVVHFIGKDIIYHHVLFWPAMLLAHGDFPPPTAVRAGGFLTLEGEKMSTSRGHVLWISDYLKDFPADYLRFYLMSAAALDQDIDFSWQNFSEKVNSELIGNFGNFINRVLSFCKSKHGGGVPKLGDLDDHDAAMIKRLELSHARVTELLSNYNFVDSVREILALSRAGNEYFQKKEPWKNPSENTINIGVNVARSLAILASPFMPETGEKILSQMNAEGNWESARGLVLKAGHKIGEVSPIFKKIEQSEIDAQIKKLKMDAKDSKNKKTESGAADDAGQILVDFDDFAKLDLRVAEVKKVEDHPNADKLYVVELDVGGEPRQIVAGIKSTYKPEELIGKKIVFIANLKPAKIRGVESKGMLLAAESGDVLSVVVPDKDISSGAKLG